MEIIKSEETQKSTVPELRTCSTQLVASIKTNPAAIKDIVKTFAPRGVPDIEKILDEGTQVSVWNRRHGKETTVKLFILFIADMNNAFNLFTPMNENQIVDLADDMATDLWFVTVEDIAAFFEAVKKGYIGRVTNRMDAPLIWSFWDLYMAKRAETVEVRQNAYKFRDPGSEKSVEDVREGKIERLGDALKTIKTQLQDKTKKIEFKPNEQPGQNNG